MQAFLNAAFDWADRRDVPMKARRDDYGDWQVTVELRDARGWFSWSLRKLRRSWREGEEHYVARTEQALEEACAKARRDRIENLTGRVVASRAA